MATTRESIEDGLRWVAGLLKIGIRRALILGVFVALFVIVVIVTTQETFSDCGDVTDQQRSLIESLRSPETGRSFVTASPAECVQGEFFAPIDGLATTMDEATRQLLGQGWVRETTYIGYYRQSWQRCFRRDLPGWERVQIIVDATRDGAVRTVRAGAPENADACELERRDESTIYPPSP